MDNTCIAVVGDFKFLYKYFPKFYLNLRSKGEYSGQIVVITSLITPTFLIKFINKKNKVTVLRFKKLKFSKSANSYLNNLQTGNQPNRHKTKPFQWHKVNLFNEKIKKWKYVFYLDVNMTIHHNINHILKVKPENKIFARSDSYPEFKNNLSSQFDKTKKQYNVLKNEYDLSKNNYFQTGILYFDTNIITKKSIEQIINLIEKYPITLTNEQGILNLYVEKYKIKVEELPINLEGYMSYFYWLVKGKKIIITKQLKEKYK